MPITSIHITGYRGLKTDNLYLPPGSYTVGDRLDVAARIVPDDLARYLVDTRQVVSYADQSEEPPAGDLDSLSVKELRELAEQQGIDLPANLKKADLIDLITHAAVQPDPAGQDQPDQPGE